MWCLPNSSPIGASCKNRNRTNTSFFCRELRDSFGQTVWQRYTFAISSQMSTNDYKRLDQCRTHRWTYNIHSWTFSVRWTYSPQSVLLPHFFVKKIAEKSQLLRRFLTVKKLLPNFDDGHKLEKINFKKKVGFSRNTANCVQPAPLHGNL
jgi:hypothetical protein